MREVPAARPFPIRGATLAPLALLGGTRVEPYAGTFSAVLRYPLQLLWWLGYALGPPGRRLRRLAWELALATTATAPHWRAVDPSGGTDGKGRGQGSGAVRAGV